MVQRIHIYHKESEIRAADSKYSIADFEYTENITINSASVITQEKKIGND